MASVAAAASHHGGVQAGFALVAAAGVAAAILVLFLPKIAKMSFVSRWKVGRWLKDHTACPQFRLAGLVPDLHLVVAPRARRLRPVQRSLRRRLVPARAGIPLRLRRLRCFADRSRGCRTQAGAGAAILILGGVPKSEAFAFAVAAQGMVIIVGAALVGAAGIWMLFTVSARRALGRPPRPHFRPSCLNRLFTQLLGGRGSMTLVFRVASSLRSSQPLAFAGAASANAAIITSHDDQGRTITFDVRAATVDTEWYASVLRASAHGERDQRRPDHHRPRAARSRRSAAGRTRRRATTRTSATIVSSRRQEQAPRDSHPARVRASPRHRSGESPGSRS